MGLFPFVSKSSTCVRGARSKPTHKDLFAHTTTRAREKPNELKNLIN
jgi:hypothetical protein